LASIPPRTPSDRELDGDMCAVDPQPSPVRASAQEKIDAMRIAEDFLDLMNEADEHWHANVALTEIILAAEARGRQQAEQARDEGQGYQRGQPYTIEQQLHDQKQRNKGLENRIRKELEPQVSALTQALKDIAERHRFPARELGPCICKEHQAADRLTGAQA